MTDSGVEQDPARRASVREAVDRCTQLVELGKRLAASATMASEVAGSARPLSELIRALECATDELRRTGGEVDAVVESAQETQVADALAAGRPLRLNIGPGSASLPDWLNVDIAGGDVVADLRRSLPFPDASASHIYCSHVLEHLRNPDESHRFLVECRRVLRRGGKLRVVVPNIGEYLRAVIAGDEDFWATHSRTWPWSRGDENRLDLTLRYAGAGPNPGDFFGHQHGYDERSLVDVLARAGFAPIILSAYQQSKDPVFRVDDQSAVAHVQHDGRPLSLFAEGYALF